MSATINGAPVTAMVLDGVPMQSAWMNGAMVWSARAGSRMDYQWDRARTGSLRILFIGSSTIQGHGVAWPEGVVYQLTAYLASHLPGVEATPMRKGTSGTYPAPSAAGFHFLNAGVGGTTANNYYGPERQSIVQSYQPNLVVHMVGSNDYGLQRSLNDYRDDLVAVTNNVLRNGISGDTRQLFIHAPRREDVDDAAVTNKWADYGRVLREVAEDTTRGEFLDAGALFDEARAHAGASDTSVFASDQVHLNERGNSLLAAVIAEWWGLDTHEDQVIYGFDAADWDHLNNGTRMSSFTPEGVLQSGTRMTASGDYRPTLKRATFNGVDSLDFTGGNRKMQTDDWGGVQALPITAYIVLSSLTASGGTASQPLWSRSGVDNGYTWAWYDRNAGTLKAASGSALSPGAPIGGDLLTGPVVIAISFLPSGHSRIHLNSLYGESVPVQSPDTNMGPWMRSLKLGTNYGDVNWSDMDVREMWWHHGADPDTVAARIAAFAAKHDIKVTTRASDWSETTSASVGTSAVPEWADTIEVVAIGAGGGGSGGGWFATGDGGRAGTWAHVSFTVAPGQTFTRKAGEAGAGGSGNSNNGSTGQPSYAELDGVRILTANGGGPGTSTNGNQPGRGAGDYTAFGRAFTGGGNASNGQVGNAPGGGGGPGNNNSAGQSGGRGRVWWRFVAH
ncbi:SGNH/GDSL hydrolase family protein [Corynebacterium sp. USCH3]|uniref:SGNH/GDSL hydrolase family protein n=1 Tax=Corynebacterium sp. USCH3 TaxID=3024840 RepID=UPI0030973D66